MLAMFSLSAYCARCYSRSYKKKATTALVLVAVRLGVSMRAMEHTCDYESLTRYCVRTVLQNRYYFVAALAGALAFHGARAVGPCRLVGFCRRFPSYDGSVWWRLPGFAPRRHGGDSPREEPAKPAGDTTAATTTTTTTPSCSPPFPFDLFAQWGCFERAVLALGLWIYLSVAPIALIMSKADGADFVALIILSFVSLTGVTFMFSSSVAKAARKAD